MDHPIISRLGAMATQRLVQPEALAPIDRAIARLAADPTQKRSALAAYEELLRAAEPLALLAADAPQVIKGDVEAALRFESLLARLAWRAPASELTQPTPTPTHVDAYEHRDDEFVRLDALMTVAVAFGTLQVNEERFAELHDGLWNAVGSLLELHSMREAALVLLRTGDPAPMQTLAWRPPAHRPKIGKHKPKPKPKPKKPRKPVGRVKIKDTHSAWLSCFRGALGRSQAQSALAPRYTVSSVQPIDACPGQQIVISGTRLGTEGTVAFHTAAGSASDYMAVNADSWSDTSIVVTVPAWARQGPLQIHSIDHTFIECHRRWAVYRLPDPAGPMNTMFLGGLPDVFDVQVDGRNVAAFARPNTNANVSWVTTPGSVTIEIRNDMDAGETHWKKDMLVGGTGTYPWKTRPVAAPTRYIVALTVTNHCGSFTKELVVWVTNPAVVSIAGIEVTQGIQTFSFAGGPRNTVATVAEKDTIVRIYPFADRGGWNNNTLTQLTASLSIGGYHFQPINKAPPGSATGGNPFIDISGPVVNRENTEASLNFRIPAWLCTGTQTISVAVFGSDELGSVFLPQSLSWTWHPKQAMKVRYVRVSYMGTQPSDWDARWTILRAFDLHPSPPLDIGPAWLTEWNTGQDLATEDGKHTFLGHLSDQHNCTFSEWLFPWEDDCPDDDGALWVAVVYGNVGGRARTGENTAWAASATFDRIAAGHELGHLRCLRHVNQGCNGDNPDESNTCGFLKGKGYDTLPAEGAVAEVAFDPYNAVVVAAPRFDFMSYACSRWVSIDNWNRLFGML